MTDLKQIIRGCKKNNPEAQKALYEVLAPKLLSTCIRYTKDRYEAEDYLQEAFIRIYLNIRSFKNKGSFEGWARRVTVNVILKDFQRKNALKHSIDIDEHTYLAESKEKVISKISHKETLDLLDMLPEGKKVVFNLYVIEGYAHKEIAKMLDITESTSKSQLSKAKDMLRELHKQLNAEYDANRVTQ